MRRLVPVFVLVASCSAVTGSPPTSPSVSDTVVGAEKDLPREGSPTTTAPDDRPDPTITPSPTTTSGRMPAPDFTLQLGEGGSYTLSEGAKPVYLVFWAEW